MTEEQLRQARLNREALERELAREIPELAVRWLARAADCAAVADAIPPQSVVVEFLRYGAFDFTAIRSRGDDAWQPPRYLAIVIGPGTQSPRSST